MIEKISIYIPAYNAENTIRDSLNSILNQSKKFDEIIIVNDCSTDKTFEILNSFKEVKIINNLKNEGLSKSRNIAISECKNDIVANIDSDIVLDEFWLENILKYLKKNDVVICGGNTQEKYLQNIYNKWRGDRYALNWGPNDIKNPPFIYGCNSIQYKNIWKEVKGYDHEYKTAGDDINYSAKISRLTKFNSFYSSKAKCYHLQDDSLNSLSDRVWRYHSFGYKIKEPSFYRLLKLILKQLKIFFQRSFEDLFKLKFFFIFINLIILIKFVYFESKFLFNKQKIK